MNGFDDAAYNMAAVSATVALAIILERTFSDRPMQSLSR
jgi:hypothetical protein